MISIPQTTAIFFHEHMMERFARRSAGSLVIACLVIYVYLAGVSVLHAVTERTLGEDIRVHQAHLADLEREYFTLAKDVGEVRGYEFGLVRASHKQFVTRATYLSDATPSARGL